MGKEVRVERKEIVLALRRVRHAGLDSDAKLILSYIDSIEARLKQTADYESVRNYAKGLAKKMGIRFADVLNEKLPKKSKGKASFGIGKGYR